MMNFDDFAKKISNVFNGVNQMIVDELEEKADLCVEEIKARTPKRSGKLKNSMARSVVKKDGKLYSVNVGSRTDIAPYAMYVELGHFQHVGQYVPTIRKRLVKPYVQGKHMISDSLSIYEKVLNESIKKRIEGGIK